MEEQIISFETAKLAKEKGFDIPTIKFYTSGKKHYLTKAEDYQSERYAESNWNNGYGSYPTSASEVECSAPTQSLLQKWLRKEHNIHVTPIPNFESKIGEYYTRIVFVDKGVISTIILKRNNERYSHIAFNSFEEALEKGLHKGLKLIDE